MCNKWKNYLFCKCCWCSCRNSKWKFYFNFFFNYRNNKKTIKLNKKQKENRDKIIMLAKSRLKSIDTLLSQALVDMEISHGKFIMISKEKDKYEKMKENLGNISKTLKGKTENMRLNSFNSRSCKNNVIVDNLQTKWFCQLKKYIFLLYVKWEMDQKDLVK